MIRTFFALAGAALTGVQAWLIYATGSGLCFSDGCEIVEKLTLVPPFYFNLLGAGFFFLIFLGSLVSKITESEECEKYVGFLLVVALAAEAVLVFFQYSIARAFCSYCLIIFSFIFLLNVLSGWRQAVRGVVVFFAVMLACCSLQFKAGESGSPLSSGTMARYQEEGNEKELVLIFSETCPHCEKVIDFLRRESFCNISFNPVEKVNTFEFEKVERNESYEPQATVGFMRSLNMKSIPLLVVMGDSEEGVHVFEGAEQIIPWLQKNCRIQESEATSSGEQSVLPAPSLNQGGMSVVPKGGFSLPVEKKKDDACKVNTDC